MPTPLEEAAGAIEDFTDALIEAGAGNIQALVIAATPAIVSHFLAKELFRDS